MVSLMVALFRDRVMKVWQDGGLRVLRPPRSTRAVSARLAVPGDDGDEQFLGLHGQVFRNEVAQPSAVHEVVKLSARGPAHGWPADFVTAGRGRWTVCAYRVTSTVCPVSMTCVFASF